MGNKSSALEVTLSQESVDVIVKAISDTMLDLLSDFLIPLREELQEIKSNGDNSNIMVDKPMLPRASQKGKRKLVNVCPDIPDDWRGGVADVARILGICPDTVAKYAKLGRRHRGLDWKPSMSGRKQFTGREVKRFWNNIR